MYSSYHLISLFTVRTNNHPPHPGPWAINQYASSQTKTRLVRRCPLHDPAAQQSNPNRQTRAAASKHPEQSCTQRDHAQPPHHQSALTMPSLASRVPCNFAGGGTRTTAALCGHWCRSARRDRDAGRGLDSAARGTPATGPYNRHPRPLDGFAPAGCIRWCLDPRIAEVIVHGFDE